MWPAAPPPGRGEPSRGTATGAQLQRDRANNKQSGPRVATRGAVEIKWSRQAERNPARFFFYNSGYSKQGGLGGHAPPEQ